MALALAMERQCKPLWLCVLAIVAWAGFALALSPEEQKFQEELFKKNAYPEGTGGFAVLAWSAGSVWGDAAGIEINGKSKLYDVGGKGINVLQINPDTAQYSSPRNYNTGDDPDASDSLAQYLSQLPLGRVVVAVCRGECANNLTPKLKQAFRSCGSDVMGSDRLTSGDSWAFIGRTGVDPGSGLIRESFNTRGRAAVTFTQAGKVQEGPRGVQGMPGPTGSIGLVGSDGPKGRMGKNGVTGLDGQEGEIGYRGGKGDKGPPGDIGVIGPVGKPGKVGPRGELGPIGKDGIPGPKGHPGQVGPEGPQGFQGPPGEKGPDGPMGEPGVVGQPGDIGIQGDKGPKGDFGLEGLQGPDGPMGKALAGVGDKLTELEQRSMELFNMQARIKLELHRRHIKYRIKLATKIKAARIAKGLIKAGEQRAKDILFPPPVEGLVLPINPKKVNPWEQHFIKDVPFKPPPTDPEMEANLFPLPASPPGEEGEEKEE